MNGGDSKMVTLIIFDARCGPRLQRRTFGVGDDCDVSTAAENRFRDKSRQMDEGTRCRVREV